LPALCSSAGILLVLSAVVKSKKGRQAAEGVKLCLFAYFETSPATEGERDNIKETKPEHRLRNWIIPRDQLVGQL
jgi:hypothetical protein